MTRHRPSDERQAQILDAALDCFLENGFQATRVDSIAHRAGLSKGALYFHFASKRAILIDLVEREFEQGGVVLESAEAGGSLLEAATAFLTWLGRPGDRRHRFFLLSGELALHDDALRERLLGHHRSFLDRITALLRRMAAEPGVELADPESTAVLLKAISDGLQGAWALGHEYPAERLFAAFVGLLRGALLPGA